MLSGHGASKEQNQDSSLDLPSSKALISLTTKSKSIAPCFYFPRSFSQETAQFRHL